jgi:hypothetical protein
MRDSSFMTSEGAPAPTVMALASDSRATTLKIHSCFAREKETAQ